MSEGYIDVDLDGTLAYYEKWKGPRVIGLPVPKMKERVQKWLEEGKTVRIFTARVSSDNPFRDAAKTAVENWCLTVFGRVLPVTAEKSYRTVELWDDRAVQVIPNTGERAVPVA